MGFKRKTIDIVVKSVVLCQLQGRPRTVDALTTNEPSGAVVEKILDDFLHLACCLTAPFVGCGSERPQQGCPAMVVVLVLSLEELRSYFPIGSGVNGLFRIGAAKADNSPGCRPAGTASSTRSFPGTRSASARRRI